MKLGDILRGAFSVWLCLSCRTIPKAEPHNKEVVSARAKPDHDPGTQLKQPPATESTHSSPACDVASVHDAPPIAQNTSPPPHRPDDSFECPYDMVKMVGGFLKVKAETPWVDQNGETGIDPAQFTEINSFCLDRTEVSLSNYRGSSDPELGKRAHLPVEVSFVEAVDFCEKIGKRLPTEEEWLFAAGGQNGYRFPWGDRLTKEGVCWALGVTSSPCTVGTSEKDTNPQGAKDLAGNVSEWVDPTRDMLQGKSIALGHAHDFCNEFGFQWSVVRVSPMQLANLSQRFGFRCASTPIYPVVVDALSTVPDGSHVRPNKNTDKPKNPKP
jgi:hypothetical protein